MAELKMHEGVGALPGMRRWEIPTWVRLANKVLAKLRFPYDLKGRMDYREDMLTPEQAANFELLIGAVLDHKVQGAFVELGCYVGHTAAIFATLLKDQDPQRPFHVFDRFDIELGATRGIREQFDENLRKVGGRMPVVHSGDLFQTVPSELPEKIAFAHIDLGVGGDTALHDRLVTHALEHVYPRLSPFGVIAIMDHHVPGITLHGFNANPGARIATERFFAGKPEPVRILYGGACSHAFIRKV